MFIVDVDIDFLVIVIFYGYIGYCIFMFYLGEYFVFYGYVVVVIDYIDFINKDVNFVENLYLGFLSMLLNCLWD